MEEVLPCGESALLGQLMQPPSPVACVCVCVCSNTHEMKSDDDVVIPFPMIRGCAIGQALRLSLHGIAHMHVQISSVASIL